MTLFIHQYADDMQLCLEFDLDKQQESICKMEVCLNDIGLWMQQNKLKLNKDNTELIAITPTRQSHKVTVHSIMISNYTVESLTTTNNLGDIFDSSMNLNEHVITLVRSCNFQLSCIGQARIYLTRDAIEKFLHAFLPSRLDSGNSLLYGLHDYQIQCLHYFPLSHDDALHQI